MFFSDDTNQHLRFYIKRSIDKYLNLILKINYFPDIFD